MDGDSSTAATGMRALPLIGAAVLAAASCLCSCAGDDDKVYAPNIDPEVTPTMTTHNVSTLISDSGVTRYRVSAPVWYIYEESAEPKWTFPLTLHLESYDNFFNKEATVDCDSATYFKNRQLWRLDGNVAIVNMAGEKFLTQQMFWDQRKQTIYSDSFIQVIRTDRIMEGYGFESNEKMTRFNVRNVSAILPVEQFKGGEGSAPDTTAASVPADTAAAAPAKPARQRASSVQRPAAEEKPAAEAKPAATVKPAPARAPETPAPRRPQRLRRNDQPQKS